MPAAAHPVFDVTVMVRTAAVDSVRTGVSTRSSSFGSRQPAR